MAIRDYISLSIGKPVVELVSWIYRTMRASVYADVQGRYFAYQGSSIDIVQGLGSERWLSLADVRKTLPNLPRYSTLHTLHPYRTRSDGAPSTEYIESLALVDLLKASQDIKSIKFLRWLRREVIFPAEQKHTTYPVR
jgi:hypothetical protein